MTETLDTKGASELLHVSVQFVQQIAKITGHKDLKMLKRYANLRGSDLADQLW